MLVELGNEHPRSDAGSPAVTYMVVPEQYTYEVQPSAADAAVEFKDHIAQAMMKDGITSLPDQEALLSVQAAWRAEGGTEPTWVWSDNEDFAVLLGEFFNCSVGRPDDLEMTHHTVAGPPGVGPEESA